MIKKILRTIYNIVPFKKYIFELLKPLTLSDKITRHLIFKGNIKVKINKYLSFLIYNKGYEIEQLLFWKGINGWEKYSNKIWLELSSQSNIIFDVGANSGVYTLLAKTVNPSSTVYAFEPIKRIFDLLQSNILMNNFENVIAINKALSNENGVAEIRDVEDGVLYEATLEAGFVESRKYLKQDKIITHKIDTITLKTLIEQYNIGSIDLMKIDVETHEPQVLEGMSTFLYQFKPILIIEILNDTIAQKLNNYFDNTKYIFYNINEDTGYTKLQTLIPSSHYNFIICPIEKEKILDAALMKCTNLI